jgi:hypothetical protein
MDKNVESYFKSKGYKVKKSASAKTIEKFETDPTSESLYKYLRVHPSCRVLFNSLSISPNDFFIDPSFFLEYFKKMLELSNTSFIYIAKCKCGAPLDKANISTSAFVFPSDKQITCNMCDLKNDINNTSYEPYFEIKLNDFLKFINLAYEYGLFFSNNVIECIYCNEFELLDNEGEDQNPKSVNLVCPKCKNIRYVLPKYILDLTLYETVKDKQGYWLEWYVWKQLRELNSTLGRVLITSEETDQISFEVDGILINNNQCFVLECKDTGSIGDTLPNLHFINEFADKWILISTKEIKESELKKAKRILKDKFVYIPPKDVDNVNSIVWDILKDKPRSLSMALSDGFY